MTTQRFICDKCNKEIIQEFDKEFELYPFSLKDEKGQCECGGLLKRNEEKITLTNDEHNATYDDMKYNKYKYFPEEYAKTRQKLLNTNKTIQDYI